MDSVVAFAVSLEGDGAVGPGLFEIAEAGSEVIMNGAFLPDTVLLATFEEQLDIRVGEDFQKERAA